MVESTDDIKTEAKDLKPDKSASNAAKVRIPIDTERIGKKTPRKRRSRRRRSRHTASGERAARRSVGNTTFPRHSIHDCIRIPKAILEQNAGKECNYKDAARFAGLTYNGDVGVELSSANKYGLLERNEGMVKPTELLRRIVRPQKQNDEIDALREGIQQAPVIGDVYKHYRGENFPETQFLRNTAIDSYDVPDDKADFFVQVFTKALEDAKLLEDVGDGQRRVLDVTYSSSAPVDSSVDHIKKLSKGVTVQATDTCFVMQPFASPHGDYYSLIYEPAISKAGLKAVRADDEIFGTGKVVDQIWRGINSASVLVAELTTRNANVFYELGLAHALRKPVILISANKQDVPFDIGHVRVIYYDVNDPYWGNKLTEKVAENILQALKDPKDAILFPK